MELTTNSILSLVATSKEERQAFVRAHIQNLKDGNADIMQSHIQAKNFEQMLKEMLSNEEYKSLILDAAELHGKNFELHNAKVQIKEAGITWDYSQCNDSKLAELEAAVKAATDKLKNRQKMLQSIPASGIADPETGEIIYPASKSSSTTVTVTLK